MKAGTEVIYHSKPATLSGYAVCFVDESYELHTLATTKSLSAAERMAAERQHFIMAIISQDGHTFTVEADSIARAR